MSQGVATAAVRLIAQFGFEDLGLLRLELLIDVDDLASRRVADSLSARYGQSSFPLFSSRVSRSGGVLSLPSVYATCRGD
jgi:hypothetical protein